MSFNAKNLTYEKNEPAFLRRLKGEYGDGSSARRERPDPRPARIKSTDEDDGPTYVIEGSNEVLSKDEYEGLLKEENKVDEAANSGGATDNAESTAQVSADERVANADEGTLERRPQQNVAEIGGPKKRKQGKVVSGDKSESLEPNSQKTHNPSEKKPKKKSKQKKVKLSFDEE